MARDKTLLSRDEVERWVSAHGGWRLEGKELVRTFDFPTFAEAMAYVNRVAHLAEAHNHHPDIEIRYVRVTLRLMTHDAGGITFRDPKLAELCDAALGR